MGVIFALLAGAGVALPLMTGFGLAPTLSLLGLGAIITYQYETPFTASSR